jgi:hypothetical protein
MLTRLDTGRRIDCYAQECSESGTITKGVNLVNAVSGYGKQTLCKAKQELEHTRLGEREVNGKGVER